MVFLNTLVMSNTKCVPEEHTRWNRPLKSKRLHQGEESPSWSKNLSLSKKKKKKKPWLGYTKCEAIELLEILNIN